MNKKARRHNNTARTGKIIIIAALIAMIAAYHATINADYKRQAAEAGLACTASVEICLAN